ncbi:MAG: hypothetical protein ACLR4Z_03705 [Butyricicoccaceae bacterium]
MMLDTDFICWKIYRHICSTDADTAAIHREDIMPSIYPDQSGILPNAKASRLRFI